MNFDGTRLFDATHELQNLVHLWSEYWVEDETNALHDDSLQLDNGRLFFSRASYERR